jgi:hypothetical protein
MLYSRLNLSRGRLAMKTWIIRPAVCIALSAVGISGAFAQAGSTGGTVGKQDKSVSGTSESGTEEAPSHSAKPGTRGVRDNKTTPTTRIAGRWQWQADCGIGGQWHGSFMIANSQGDSFGGSFTSDLSSSGTAGNAVPQLISNGQISGDQVSFDRHVGGYVQNWTGTITSGRMTGSLRAPVGGCTWGAIR